METIIGFIAGYLTGVSQGREGMERARTSLDAIRTSPEVRRMVADRVGSPLCDPAGRTHALVRERRLGGISSHAAVYPALPAGDYTIWRDAGSPAGTVRIDGGAATSYRWAEPG